MLIATRSTVTNSRSARPGSMRRLRLVGHLLGVAVFVVPLRNILVLGVPVYLSDVGAATSCVALALECRVRRTAPTIARQPRVLLLVAALGTMPSMVVASFSVGPSSVYVYGRVLVWMLVPFLVLRCVGPAGWAVVAPRLVAWSFVAALISLVSVLQRDIWLQLFAPVQFRGGSSNGAVVRLFPDLAGFAPRETARIGGSVASATAYAGLLALGLALTFVAFRSRRRGFKFIALTGVHGLALGLTLSRHGVLALMVGALAAFLVHPKPAGVRSASPRPVPLGVRVFVVAVVSSIVLVSLAPDKESTNVVDARGRVTSLSSLGSDANVQERLGNYPEFVDRVVFNPTVLLLGQGHPLLVSADRSRPLTKDDRRALTQGFVSNSLLLPTLSFGIFGSASLLLCYGALAARGTVRRSRTRLGAFCVGTVLVIMISDNYAFMIPPIFGAILLVLCWVYSASFIPDETYTDHVGEAVGTSE